MSKHAQGRFAAPSIAPVCVYTARMDGPPESAGIVIEFSAVRNGQPFGQPLPMAFTMEGAKALMDGIAKAVASIALDDNE